MSEFKENAQLFRILSHPARLQILDILRGGEECVCHIQSLLNKRQAYVSQQLMVLRDAGLVTDRKDGLNVFYRLADPAVADLLKVVLGPVEERASCQETACPHCHSS
ncbi:MAG: metalloregulator ArsR/SmtB family transcription factor [Anaerolineae bacterium]|jgi:DNA-binding transcriptional ArsR family regulator|nr:metalloregulator ArsR/SmtB family transcription factor [Anaerolineae bacterium]